MKRTENRRQRAEDRKRKTATSSFFGLTEAGKVVLEGAGFVALTALVFPAFGVLSTLICIVLAALVGGFVLRPRIRLSGNLPECVMAGQTVRLTYLLENVGRFAAYNLGVKFTALPEAIEQIEDGRVVSRLVSGGTAEVTVAIRPRRRGRYNIKQPVCRSSFPFNLFNFGCTCGEEQSLLVLPTFSMLQISARGPSRQVLAGTTRLAGRMGFSPEYAGNRPFRPGDSPRKIDARAWARLSVPATKEYHDDLDSYVALVLDTAAPDGVAGTCHGRPARDPKAGRPRHDAAKMTTTSQDASDALEAAVSLCASVAFSINNESLIELLLAGPELHQFTDRPRTARVQMIHEILAGVELSQGGSLERIESILANRFFEISDVIFILSGWKRAYGPLLKMACQAGCRTTVLIVGRAGPIPPEQDHLNWTSDVRVLSPEEILAGQVRDL
jgi:uncharacterized protein (DUF58 family)